MLYAILAAKELSSFLSSIIADAILLIGVRLIIDLDVCFKVALISDCHLTQQRTLKKTIRNPQQMLKKGIPSSLQPPESQTVQTDFYTIFLTQKTPIQHR